jgi:hypothetical protein
VVIDPTNLCPSGIRACLYSLRSHQRGAGVKRKDKCYADFRGLRGLRRLCDIDTLHVGLKSRSPISSSSKCSDKYTHDTRYGRVLEVCSIAGRHLCSETGSIILLTCLCGRVFTSTACIIYTGRTRQHLTTSPSISIFVDSQASKLRLYTRGSRFLLSWASSRKGRAVLQTLDRKPRTLESSKVPADRRIPLVHLWTVSWMVRCYLKISTSSGTDCCRSDRSFPAAFFSCNFCAVSHRTR